MYSCPLIISCWPSARAMQSHTPPDAQRVQRSAPYNYGYLTEAFIFNYYTDLSDSAYLHIPCIVPPVRVCVQYTSQADTDDFRLISQIRISKIDSATNCVQKTRDLNI